MSRILIILFFLIISCNRNNNIEIKNLNFSDLNQQGIFKNKIKTSYLISDFVSDSLKKNDTIAIITYNQNGYTEYEYWKSLFYSTKITYEYDNLNLIKTKSHATDFVLTFNYNYIFKPDSLILYKNYNTQNHKDYNNKKRKTSALYKFSKNGMLTESFQYQDNDSDAGEKLITKYKYDSLGLLVSKKIFIKYNSKLDQESKLFKSTTFYYTHKKIDSSITFIYDNSLEKFKLKTIYDNNELISKTIDNNNFVISYKHINKDY